MVAFLAGLVVLLALLLVGALATIEAKNERIAELEELHAPPTSAPVAVVRTCNAPAVAAAGPCLPKLYDLVGNDEKTLNCQTATVRQTPAR